MTTHTRTSRPTGKATKVVLAAVTATNTVFCRVTPRSLTEIFRRLDWNNQSVFRVVCPESGNSVTARNVRKFWSETHGVSHFRRERGGLCVACLSSSASTSPCLVQDVIFGCNHQIVAQFEVFVAAVYVGLGFTRQAVNSHLLTYTAQNVTWRQDPYWVEHCTRCLDTHTHTHTHTHRNVATVCWTRIVTIVCDCIYLIYIYIYI
jgi:hypothetical protein